MTKRSNPDRDAANKAYWDKIVKNFPLSSNCLILTLEGTSVGHSKSLSDMTAAINRLNVYKNIIVGSVKSFDHIQVLDEK